MLKNFFVSPFWGRIFNKYTLIKIFIIFIVGFICRVLIATTLGVNLVLEFTSFISIVCFSEVVAYFNFCIFPKFIIDLFIGISKVNFNSLKLSSIKNAVSYYFNRNKVKLTVSDYKSNDSFNDNGLKNSKLYNFNSSENLSNSDKFRNKSKRMLFWVLWEKYTNNFDSYKTFKETWDPNMKVRTIIKKDIKDSVWKVKVFKNTAKRIWDMIHPDR